MQKILTVKNIVVGLLILLPILFNLYLLLPELKIYSDVNDNVFAYALAFRMNQAWDEGNCPWNPVTCLPKLTDHWVSYWAMGYPLPQYYQHLPSIFNVALFKILANLGFVANTTSVLEANQQLTQAGSPAGNDYMLPGLFTVFNWTKYLLLCLYPLAIYWSCRKFQFPKLAAGLSALLSTLISTNYQYGTDYGALIWRGSGMHTQLWGMFFLPLAVASIYDSLIHSENKRVPHLSRSILLLILTFSSHVLYGYIASLSSLFILLTILINHHLKNKLIVSEKMSRTNTVINSSNKVSRQVIDLALKEYRLIKRPLVILSAIFILTFITLSYWLIPLFANDAYHAHSVWDELYKFNSFGAREVINRYFAGEIFDFGRFPVFTILVFTGLFYGLNQFVKQIYAKQNKDEPSYLLFPLLLVFWTLMYFGRTTWGSLTNLLPSSEGIHMHRFINGVHFAGIFLAGLGLYWLALKAQILMQTAGRVFSLIQNLPDENTSKDINNHNYNIKHYLFNDQTKMPEAGYFLTIISFILLPLFFLYPASRERYLFLQENTHLLNYYNEDYLKDWPNFQKAMDKIKNLQKDNPGRIWAGRPGNWGKNFKVGGTETYLTLSVNGFDTLGFEPESWSPNTDIEQYFNDQRLDHYNLFNIRYILAPVEAKFPPFAQKIDVFGKYNLYMVDTTGNFDYMASDLNIYGDKYNTLNILRFWLDSKWPEAKNNPLVFYKQEYDSKSNTIELVDWTNYRWSRDARTIQIPLSLLTLNPFNATPSSEVIANQKTKILVLPPVTDKQLSGKISQNDKYSVLSITSVPSLLLLKATYHPFWTAYVNGQKVEHIQMTAPYFMSIKLPAGENKVEFIYQAQSYKKILLLLSFGALIIVMISPLIARYILKGSK